MLVQLYQKELPGFQDPGPIATYRHFFRWLRRTKATLYETQDYRGEPTHIVDAMFLNMVHYRAMPLQVRQIRVKAGEFVILQDRVVLYWYKSDAVGMVV